MRRVPRSARVFSYSAEHEPAVRVSPGETLLVETKNAFGDQTFSPGETLEELSLEGADPLTGPIFVDGAEPGDTLAVEIDDITDWIRHRDFGVYGRVVDVDGGEVVWDERTRIPVQPMVGVIATAPLVEAVSTIDNGPHGGNIDVQEVAPGTRLYLPVAVPGALFFLGDCHAVQGDGELCGIGAIEIRTHTTVRLDLAERPGRMRWPRFETAEHLGTIACAKPLEDAFRLAVEELVYWMADDYGFEEHEAVLLLGQVAEARCTQLVNPKYTYVAKIAKRYLEGRRLVHADR